MIIQCVSQNIIASPCRVLVRLCAAWLFAIASLTASFPALSECSPRDPNCSDTLTKEFPIEGGTLLIKNVQLFPDSLYGVRVKGEIENRSNLNLSVASVTISMFDKSRNFLGKGDLYVYNLNVGESKAVASDYGQDKGQAIDIKGRDGTRIYATTFEIGTVKPTKKFVISMAKPKQSKELQNVDEYAEFQFSISNSRISFEILNKTD